VGLLCCIAVGVMSLLHCAWLVLRVGVLCCIVVGQDPRTPFFRCARPHRYAWLRCARKRAACTVVGGDPRTLFLSLSLLFAHLPAHRDMHEAPHHPAVLKNTQACDASRLRRLESSRIALLFWRAWPAAPSAGAHPAVCSTLPNKQFSLVCKTTFKRSRGPSAP
jgi:hypothetical protein